MIRSKPELFNKLVSFFFSLVDIPKEKIDKYLNEYIAKYKDKNMISEIIYIESDNNVEEKAKEILTKKYNTSFIEIVYIFPIFSDTSLN